MKSFLFLYLFLICSVALGQIERCLERADIYFSLGEYASALNYYKYLIKKKQDPALWIRVGHCYRLLNKPREAEYFYSLVQTSSLDTNTYYYGEMLKRNGKYAEAKLQFKKLSEVFPENPIYNKLIISCDSSMLWLKEKSGLRVENLKKINTEWSEITPVEYDSSIVFASNREEILIKRKTGSTEQPFYNLYIASENSTGRGKFSSPRSFSSVINTIHHETSPSFTGDYQKIFFTQIKYQKQHSSDTAKRNRPKLYSSNKKNGVWKKAEKFIFNDSSYSFGHPSVDVSDKMFFFASDMPGGYGGSDIYVCFNLDGLWSDPVNLGPVINTSGNELYPFYHQKGVLYFSSDAHLGMGGLDIFYAVQEYGDWVKVFNMRSPVNSPADDFSLYFNKDLTIGYFSSNRPGGKGLEDIYMISTK